MRRLRVYVAGPYSRPDPEANTRRAITAADELLRAGLAPFVPHLGHFWDRVIDCPHDYETWMDWCLAWVVACDALLRLPGESAGADREVDEARRHGIPVFEDAALLLAWSRER